MLKTEKKKKPKYSEGQYIKDVNGKLFQVAGILDVYEHYQALEVNVFGEEIGTDTYLIAFKNAVKVFKPQKRKYSKRELEELKTKLARESYVVPANTEELLEFIEIVNTETSYPYIAAMLASTDIGFDIETFGIACQDDALGPELGQIRLIQVYLPEVNCCLVWDLGNFANSESDFPYRKELQKVLSSKAIKKFIHNAAFESAWIAEKLQVPILNVVDSMILSQVYWAGLAKGFRSKGIDRPNSLEQVCLRVLGIKPDKANQLFDYFLTLNNSQYNYAALDAKYTLDVGQKLLSMCSAEGLDKVVKAEMASIPAFAQMRYKGVPFNPEVAKKLLIEYETAATAALEPWVKRFPSVNPGSPKQVLECLVELGIEPKDATGKACTDNPTLTPYALENPIVESLLMWRSLKKDCEYLESYIASVGTVRGFQVIRGNYQQLAPQATGRSACSKPNLQNIPTPTVKRKALGLRPLRLAFEAPKGYKMIIVDLAASHAQLARWFSKDSKLQEAHDTGIKLHFFTVSGILKLSGIDATPSELSKAKKDKTHELYSKVAELYDPSKTVFYGGLNLNGAATLQASFLKKADMLVPLDVCKSYVDGGRAAYPKLYEFQKRQIAFANTQAFQKTFDVLDPSGETVKLGQLRGIYGTAKSFDGGRLYVEKFPSKYKENTWECSGTDVVSFNWLRPEATIVKNAMGVVNDKLLTTREWQAWICQMTHDEIGIIVKEEYAEACAIFAVRAVTDCFKEVVPDYEAESYNPDDYICNNWSEK